MLQSGKYRGGGRIIQGALRAEVDCEYEVRRVDEFVEWHGRFSDADPTSEPDPGAARLFARGKGGEIIRRVGAGGNGGRAIRGRRPSARLTRRTSPTMATKDPIKEKLKDLRNLVQHGEEGPPVAFYALPDGLAKEGAEQLVLTRSEMDIGTSLVARWLDVLVC